MNAGDLVALQLQELHRRGKLRSRQSLLRIDCRPEAARAPFCFDIVSGRLHRTGCGAIPEDCRDALYFVWDPGRELRYVACPKCQPAEKKAGPVKRDTSTDIIYGLLSIVDQFGSVLSQRGQEFRKSPRGRRLKKNLNDLVSTLSQTQRDALNLTLTSLDGLIRIVGGISTSLERQAGMNNGHGGKRRSPRPPAGRNGKEEV